ncbi:hypothetical protein RU639_006918 [Aspergillus parasiticus]
MHDNKLQDTLGSPPQASFVSDNRSVEGRPSMEKGSTLAGSQEGSPALASEAKNENSITVANTSPGDEAEQEEEEEYPGAWKLGLITIALALAIFCLALDNTIISTAIPKITDQFKSLEDVGCCIRSTLQTGLGAAGLFSGALIIIAQTVPLNRRPIFSAMMGSMYGIASVAGPLMGGAFTDRLSWRWCFYINLPFGGVTAFFILFFFKAPKSVKDNSGFKNQIGQLDFPGTALFMPSIICVLLALQWGGTVYAWNNARIIALFVVFGVLLIAFCGVQWWQQDKATVPPRLAKNRNVWGAAAYSFCVGGAFFIYIYYLPIWFQAIKGVTATRSGIMNLPLLLPMIVSSIAAGACVTMVGYYTPFMIATPILMSIGGGLLSTLKVDSGDAAWIGYQILFGIGVGLGMQQPMIVVQAALPIADVPTATAIVMFTQTLGGALFVSVAQNVFQNQLRKNILARAPEVDIAKVVGAGATMLRQAVSKDILPTVLESYNDAITQTFYAAVAIGAIGFFAALPIQWLSVKGKKIGAMAA